MTLMLPCAPESPGCSTYLIGPSSAGNESCALNFFANRFCPFGILTELCWTSFLYLYGNFSLSKIHLLLTISLSFYICASILNMLLDSLRTGIFVNYNYSCFYLSWLKSPLVGLTGFDIGEAWSSLLTSFTIFSYKFCLFWYCFMCTLKDWFLAAPTKWDEVWVLSWEIWRMCFRRWGESSWRSALFCWRRWFILLSLPKLGIES